MLLQFKSYSQFKSAVVNAMRTIDGIKVSIQNFLTTFVNAS